MASATDKRDLKIVLAEAHALKEKHEGKVWPEDVAKKFKELTDEGKAIQDESDRERELKALDDFASTVPDPVLPAGKKAYEDNTPVGYISAGQALVESASYTDFLAHGMPKQRPAQFGFKGFFGQDRFIPLDKKAMQERMESKAVPTIGADVIAPTRLAEVIKSYEDDRLVVRDLVTILPTASDSVLFIKFTSDQPSAATGVATSGLKPEATLALDTGTAPVRTIAVHMPVPEQTLSDVPQIRAMIDGYLRFDLARFEEYQEIWGDGTGQELLGIMETPGVTEMTRTPDIGAGSTPTLLDNIRAAMTDIRVNNLEPNGITIHPIDFETLVLQKGSDDHYLVQTFPTQDGGHRVWSLTIVETPAAQAYRAADATDQRVVIVGDFRRGAILWDRQQASVEVGFIDNQFILNQRTIRAEERLAFAVVRPRAFKWIETVAAA